MENSGRLRSYRLIFSEEGSGATLEVEFDETSPDPAFKIAEKACGTGEVQIFADDQLLGRLRRSPGGFSVFS